MKKTALRFIAYIVVLCTVVSAGTAFAEGKPIQAAVARSRVECSNVPSSILSRSVPYCVMLPPSYTRDAARRYPVSYFLHGIGDSEQVLVNLSDWGIYDRLLAQRTVGEFVIIAPFGFTSFYINSHDGSFRYEDFFLGEFLPAMERRYRIDSTGAKRGIMGVSMGGYGALHYGFKYPQKFAAISGTMPALMDRPPRALGEPLVRDALAAVFGNPPDPAFFAQNSPMNLARVAPLAAVRPLTIYFDCGDQDRYGFDRGVGQLDELLTGRGVAHEAHIFPGGGHNWSFVEQHLDAAFKAQSHGLGAK